MALQTRLTRYFPRQAPTHSLPYYGPVRPFLPENPYPELSSGNDAADDAQMRTILDLVASVEVELSITKNEVAREWLEIALLQQNLQVSLMDALIAEKRLSMRRWIFQSDHLESFLRAHANVGSRLRHLPNELLGEIFAYCVSIDLGSPFCCGYSLSIMRIAAVCRRWRAIALSMPRLWSNIALLPYDHLRPDTWDNVVWGVEGSSSILLDHNIRIRGLRHLERVGQHVPLAITVAINISETSWLPNALLPRYLGHSHRWEMAYLTLYHDQFSFFEKWALQHEFDLLHTIVLAFASGHTIRAPIEFSSFLHELPVLRDLTLHCLDGFCSFPLALAPWTQLRVLSIKGPGCSALDIFSLLPKLSSGVELKLADIAMAEWDELALPEPGSQVKMSLGRLDLVDCQRRFVHLLIEFLARMGRAPELHCFCYRNLSHYADPLPQITLFLSSLSCRLSELHLTVPADFVANTSPVLFEAFSSDCLKGLEVLSVSGRSFSAVVVAHLGTAPASKDTINTPSLPKLRALTFMFWGQQTPDLGLTLVAVRSKHPQLHEVRIVNPENEVDIAFKTLSGLQKNGVSVFISSEWA
ncbi:F-box domain-containing protein [Mycena chlorophos]|uniref:F-box domain-containing protein n=1 Tax=Mycena chlorophos TaxID=658473 RepID=A0A8H6WG97_MYCCL|nr:F-box domain-containing protein [Mycena chlorophos]